MKKSLLACIRREDDSSDAFRHNCWNIFLKEHLGYSWASRWEMAHEATYSGALVPTTGGRMNYNE